MNNVNSIWDDLSTAEHEHQYNPQATFPHFADVRARLAPLNEAARAKHGSPTGVAYGRHPLNRLDIFSAPGVGPHPVHVFYHGGYWRAQDKENFAFIAAQLVPLGITTVIANYELCPGSDLVAVTESAINSFRWVTENIADHGGDPTRLSLSGHSAGAHLGAAILADQSRKGTIGGAILTSGIFDPRPAIRTSVNAQLQITEQIALRTDMSQRMPVNTDAISIQVGALETAHWIDQSLRYFSTLRHAGLQPELHVMEGRDHFDILEDYLDPAGLTISTIRKFCDVRGQDN